MQIRLCRLSHALFALVEADISGFRPARSRPGLKSRAGWRKVGRAYLSGTAPVSARRFPHTRRVLENPAGISLPAGLTRNPAGWSGNRFPVAPVKS